MARPEDAAKVFGASLEEALHLARVIQDHDVLIVGETGAGKEGVARALQAGTLAPAGEVAPSPAVNAAAIPDTLLESELFGSEKGAYTGATTRRTGKIEAANGGTLLLDEIGDMPVALQAKLLRFTDSLVRLFGSSRRPLRALRNLGMLGFDLVPGVRSVFAKHTMGLAGNLPRLSRGVPLK